MNFKFLQGLRGRMLISIGGSAFVGLSVVTIIMAFATSRQAERDAIAAARNQATMRAERVDAQIEESLFVARGLAAAFEGMRSGAEPPSRALADALMRQLAEKNSQILGIWTVWEPNAFDGRDAEFVGKPGHDVTGRYVPYWNRGDGKISVEPNKNYTVAGEGDYYLIPKQTKTETALEPYVYKVGNREALITSLAVPILSSAGEVIGVVGVDLELDILAKEIVSLGDGSSGFAALVSNSGLYIAHPEKARIGKPIFASDTWAEPLRENLKRGESFLVQTHSQDLNDDTYHISAPVVIGRTTTPWNIVVTLLKSDMLASATRIRDIVIVTGAAVLVALMLVVWRLSNGIARPIRQVADSLKLGADHVASASSQVSSASQTLAEGTSEQAASLEETSSSCEEMSGMTQRNAQSAGTAKVLAGETRHAADAGANDMRELSTAMSDLKTAGANVAKIVKTIDEIAFQTNILALNAAVEAARAGESGAGFAVVAEEVRNLAQRSAQAAKETAATIETTIEQSERGYTVSQKVAAGLQQIVDKARKVDELIGEISTASAEQSEGVNQINHAIRLMDKITQDGAATAEESASASEELNAQAATLKEAAQQLLEIVAGRNAAGTPETAVASVPQERSAAPTGRRMAAPKGGQRRQIATAGEAATPVMN